MSHHGLPPVRQEDDQIRGVLVFIIIMGATAFGTLCVFVMWLLWRADSLAFNPNAFQEVKEVTVRPSEIAGVSQTLINVDTATRRLNTERRRHLEQHNWIDQRAGVAQIPIEEAMRALVEGTAAALGAIAGAGPPSAGPGASGGAGGGGGGGGAGGSGSSGSSGRSGSSGAGEVQQ
jgi:uncharacterized membrane protein YgcG